MPKASARRERAAKARLTETPSPGRKQADGGKEEHWGPQGQGGLKPRPRPSPPHPELHGSFLVMLGNCRATLVSVGRDLRSTDIEASLNLLATLLLMKPHIHFSFPLRRAHGCSY